MRTIKFTLIDDEGLETEHTLPARNEVCGRCEGHGTILNPSIGSHAYSREEFEESFDDEEREEYFKRGGRYDVQCPECKGRNVVAVVDEEACRTPTQKELLAKYEESERERARSDAEDRRTYHLEGGYLEH